MSDDASRAELVDRLKKTLSPSDTKVADDLTTLLKELPSSELARIAEELTAEQVAHLFTTLETKRAAELAAKLEPELAKEVFKHLRPDRLAELTELLPPREAAAVVCEAPRRHIQTFLARSAAHPSAAQDLQRRLAYPDGSAGRIMTEQFVRLEQGTTIEEAVAAVSRTDPSVDLPNNLYVVETIDFEQHRRERLIGVISIRALLMSDRSHRVDDVMARDIISVPADADDDVAADILSKYKFLTLPVTDRDGFLAGVIPADDLMQVVVARMHRRYAKTVGTDAEAMERLSPLQAAKKRVPWLLGTMAIELGAGVVISRFDQVLKEVILLASFMPVISAISGNVGLQAAAITVRALDAGAMPVKSRWKALYKEGATSMLMAVVCGLTLGAIGAMWSKHVPFGVVIGAALTCSMLTAALMGTVIPQVSKRLGFDPATTAGPFETAFQDVIGFSVFLWLATLLKHWIV